MNNQQTRRPRLPYGASLPEKLAHYSGVDLGTGCVLWTGALSGTMRYGKIFWEGRSEFAHRMAWIDRHGPIPAGKRVLHRCDVPACVNVDHLYLGTQSENIREMFDKGRNNIYTRPRPPTVTETMRQVGEKEWADHDAPFHTMVERIYLAMEAQRRRERAPRHRKKE